MYVCPGYSSGELEALSNAEMVLIFHITHAAQMCYEQMNSPRCKLNLMLNRAIEYRASKIH